MKHIQNITIQMKDGRQVIVTSIPSNANPFRAEIGSGTTTSLSRVQAHSIVQDTQHMDLNLDYISKTGVTSPYP